MAAHGLSRRTVLRLGFLICICSLLLSIYFLYLCIFIVHSTSRDRGDVSALSSPLEARQISELQSEYSLLQTQTQLLGEYLRQVKTHPETLTVQALNQWTRNLKSLRSVAARWKNVQRIDQLQSQFTSSDVLDGGSRMLTCNEIESFEIVGELGKGYTKIVQKAVFGGQEYAVKSVAEDSVDIENCLTTQRTNVPEDCLTFSKYKIQKEILLHMQLKHPNLLTMLGFCMRGDIADDKSRGLTMVTELGEKLDVIKMLQMPWERKLRLIIGLARLAYYLERSPIGPLIVRDFRLAQFVMVGDDIKLSDIDDVDGEEHRCSNHTDCFVGNERRNATVPCLQGVCRGYNSLTNVYNINKHFIQHILKLEAPRELQTELDRIVSACGALKWDAKTLLKELENVVDLLKTGEYLKRRSTKHKSRTYQEIQQADFPELHDYYCERSRSAMNCEREVFDLDDAKHQCDQDTRCRSFVLSPLKTWLGHTIVYFKNNNTGASYNERTIVYSKVT